MFIIEVMHMAPFKQHMYQHLRSAKEWLTKAEEAFDKEHDVRAELDLMLAQAELQHAKETNRSRQWQYKYLLFRHGVALSLALFMTVLAGGVYWWVHKPVLPIPTPVVPQVASSSEHVGKSEDQVKAVTMMTEEEKSSTEVTTLRSDQKKAPAKTEQIQKQVEPAVILSNDEMQKLVRAAGKSLRGQ